MYWVLPQFRLFGLGKLRPRRNWLLVIKSESLKTKLKLLNKGLSYYLIRHFYSRYTGIAVKNPNIFTCVFSLLTLSGIFCDVFLRQAAGHVLEISFCTEQRNMVRGYSYKNFYYVERGFIILINVHGYCD